MEIIRSMGLNVFLNRAPVEKQAVWHSLTPPGHWIGMVLEGDIAVHQERFGERRWSSGGTTVFSSESAVATRHTALAEGVISAVFIQLEDDSAATLVGGDILSKIAQRGPEPLALLPNITRNIAWQMLGCQFEGATRRLWMTGKAMEMVAHVVDLATGQNRSHALGARDIARLHEARDILIAEQKMPPSVSELARRVGTNARKLGEGFQELFGHTVYGFVKMVRMETARALLEQGETSIAFVAREVGYQPQHFATEFRRRYGLAPSEFASGRR
jgi:AraC family transcriptional regulator, transcriptional activator of the genes for pyochelin and ferripyochelin receptors